MGKKYQKHFELKKILKGHYKGIKKYKVVKQKENINNEKVYRR